MAPRRRLQAPVTVELPEPLWAQIASHMSTKDWAMVSGTCKTFFNLQPGTINIPSATPPAGVIWASNRFDAVEVLRLGPIGALGLATTGVPDTLMHLKQLEIGILSAAETTTAFMTWITLVLSRAQKLTLLSASVGHLSLPPMMHLKHLVLRCNRRPGKIFAALPHAQSLQTLCLRVGRTSGRRARVLDAPRLELGSLPNLRAVALQGVCPEGTLLPKECVLHLDVLDALWIIGREEWSAALANLHTLSIVDRHLYLTRLPDLLEKVEQLRQLCIVSIHVEELGTGGAPVSLANLAHVQYLSVGADREVYVIVPAKVSWHKLGLWCAERVEVTFEDMDAFARTVRSCAFTSDNLARPRLFELCNTLAEHGIPWASCERENGETTLAFPTIDAGGLPDCSCGACMKCLRASGLAEAYSEVLSREDVARLGEESSDNDSEWYESSYADSESDGD